MVVGEAMEVVLFQERTQQRLIDLLLMLPVGLLRVLFTMVSAIDALFRFLMELALLSLYLFMLIPIIPVRRDMMNNICKKLLDKPLI